MLASDTLDRYRSNAAAMDNRAAFEIPDMIEGILSREARGR